MKFEYALGPIVNLIYKAKFKGTRKNTDPIAPSLASAILSAFSYRQLDVVKESVGLFDTAEDCEKAVAEAFGQVVGLEEWERLLIDP